jgi:hypothetical protein
MMPTEGNVYRNVTGSAGSDVEWLEERALGGGGDSGSGQTSSFVGGDRN